MGSGNIIRVQDVIQLHAVIPTGHHEPYDIHTHGLEKFGHKEFQVFAPGYCVGAMADLLNWHADRVLNRGQRFAGGETFRDAASHTVSGYVEVPGDQAGDPSRLRIVDLPDQSCTSCKHRKGGV